MNLDEAAQYFGYQDAIQLEANDLGEAFEFWELIKILIEVIKHNKND